MKPISGGQRYPTGAYGSSSDGRDLRYRRFVSGAAKVDPDQFSGDITERRAVDSAQSVETLTSRAGSFGRLALAGATIGGSIILADRLGYTLALEGPPRVAIRRLEEIGFVLSLMGIGVFGSILVFAVRRRIKALTERLEAAATHRSLYLGSAQYKIGVGDEGFCVWSNRLSCKIDYHAIDHDLFVEKNALSGIAPQTLDRLGGMSLAAIIKKSWSTPDEQGACADLHASVDAWWAQRESDHRERLKTGEFEDLVILIPFKINPVWLHRRDQSSTRPGRFQSRVRQLKSETLRLPTQALQSTVDSNLSVRELVVALHVMSYRDKRRSV